MEDNKEIVKWLSHMNSVRSNTTVPDTTLEKPQHFEDKQEIFDRFKLPNDNPNLNHLRNAINEMTAEDAALAKEFLEFMNELQINPQTLANDVKDNLHKVSSVLTSQGLTDTDETALIISMDARKIEEKKQSRINRRLKAKYEDTLNKCAVLEKKLNNLKDNVGLIRNSIEENETEYKNEYPNYKLLSAKLMEYNATVRAMEADIDSLNPRELEPEKILEKYKRFVEKKGELSEINKSLTPYGSLPPNLLQAKALVESKELEYIEINKSLSMTP